MVYNYISQQVTLFVCDMKITGCSEDNIKYAENMIFFKAKHCGGKL